MREQTSWSARPAPWGVILGVLVLHVLVVTAVARAGRLNPAPLPEKAVPGVLEVRLVSVLPVEPPAARPAMPAVPEQRAMDRLPAPARPSPRVPVAPDVVLSQTPALQSVPSPQVPSAAVATGGEPSPSRSALASLTEAPEKASPAEPVRVAAEDLLCLHRPGPTYPMASRRMGEQGTVLVRVLLDDAGAVRTATVETGSGHRRLDEAALQAIAGWRCRPPLRQGRAVPAEALQPIHFTLSP